MTSKTLLLVPLFLVAPAFAEGAKSEPPPPAAKTFEVEGVADIDYYQGADADTIKHKLDLFLPKGHKDFPVLFFVHGGAWRQGDKNISKYGGDPTALFLCGHSAGGHLVSLLATDRSYLKAEGIDKEDVIRGVIPISGVY